MDADTPIISINQVLNDLSVARARVAGTKARAIAEGDALNRIQPADNLNAGPPSLRPRTR